ncbi:PREDICTED: uncharacterized protein LOC104806031 [Tarenaya hassleriana]|uniref:uncharacterized protein LOC104806031 n=1 Tax=Tarenaya hassleriana TaxID=28532 RepID=UPI00053C3475|nr:PREDICTED: uncharacterized protein LOC104806031 [Tarenaya hassleriana]
MKMRINMKAQGVWEAVESQGPIDPRLDMLALTVICQGLDEETLQQLEEKTSAKEVWDALRTMHLGDAQVKKVRAQSLRREFEGIRMKESESVDEFTGRISTVVSQLTALGETVGEIQVVEKMLRSVTGKYLQLTSMMEQFRDLTKMTIEEVKGALKAHEERLKDLDSRDDKHVLLARGEWKGHGPGRGKWHDRGRGHLGGDRGNQSLNKSSKTKMTIEEVKGALKAHEECL